jgi:topoisomerase-4 subunit A
LDKYPRFEVKTKADKKAGIETQTILVDEFVEVRGWKAIGQKINTYEVVEVKQLEPKAEEIAVVEVPQALDDNSEKDSENVDNQDDDKQLALF